ncbi:MAG: histidine phosphatase family protein [Ilumatobacteraceae bacterium]|nr:histidine phosphatase family protein [Ilumatobacteraceae bacterium]
MSASATLYLVRHAKAGSRSAWDGDDTVRPLSRAGWAQAEALADKLGEKSPPRLVSSPSLRCIQTLEPLGKAIGIKVEPDDRLFEGGNVLPVLDLLDELPHRSVLCSHGDIIPGTVMALERRGMEITGVPDWRKASVWVLRRKGDGYDRGKSWPPPS